jgi:hypothetical protein
LKWHRPNLPIRTKPSTCYLTCRSVLLPFLPVHTLPSPLPVGRGRRAAPGEGVRTIDRLYPSPRPSPHGRGRSCRICKRPTPPAFRRPGRPSGRAGIHSHIGLPCGELRGEWAPARLDGATKEGGVLWRAMEEYVTRIALRSGLLALSRWSGSLTRSDRTMRRLRALKRQSSYRTWR